jgi:hypothetical protein
MNATAVRPVRDQGAIDREHLRLLSIFHFVAAGMAVVGLLFLVGHYALFSMFFSDPQMWHKAQGAQNMPDPRFMMGMFRVFYMVFGTWFLASAVINVLSGVFMRRMQHRLFSLIVAGFNCLHMPLGTILGVFTFIVLCRESVARDYAGQPPAAVS